LITPTTISYKSLRKWISKFTSYRQILTCSHFVKSSLSDSVEFSGTSKFVFGVWCC